MDQSVYLGHPSQLCGVEEVRLVGGKGDGMRLLQVRNAAGLELTISADRCADISRLIFKGDNMGYFSRADMSIRRITTLSVQASSRVSRLAF